MVRNGTNNRRTGRPRRAQTPRHLKRIIDRLDYGCKFVPSTDPPEFSRSPWWPVTLVFRPEAVSSYSYRNIQDALKVFFGVKEFKDSTDAVFDPFLIRPQTIRMWGLEKQGINLEVYEIIGAGTHRVKQLADMGSGMNFSRVGWRYGASAQIDPNKAETVPVFAVTPNGKSLIYLQALICLSAGFEVSKLVNLSPPGHLTLDSMSLE